MMDDKQQAEFHQQKLTEKAAREQLRGIQINSWPHDENGQPMAIVIGAGSDLVPTVQFGNCVIGPVTIMRPVPNDPDRLAEQAAFVQDTAAYVVATRRRLLQYALDPSSRITHPTTGEAFDPAVAQAALAQTPAAEPAVEPQTPAVAAEAAASAPNGSPASASVG